MACIPCQKARSALGNTIQSIASGDVQSTKANATALRDALAEKAESLRVRALTRGNRESA